MDPDTPEPWKELAEIAASGTASELEDYVDQLPAGDVALAMSRLSDDQQNSVLTTLPPENAADLVEQLPDVQAVDLIEQLDPHAAAAILDQLPSDEQADLIGDLGHDDAEAILAEMEPVEAEGRPGAAANTRMTWPAGLMVTGVLALPRTPHRRRRRRGHAIARRRVSRLRRPDMLMCAIRKGRSDRRAAAPRPAARRQGRPSTN